MTNQEIYDLIARFDSSSLHTLKLTCKDFSIELGRNAAPAAVPAAVQAVPAAPAAQAEENAPVIAAPLVGTFYAAPAPDQPPFAAPGAVMKKGETVCLLEAMKTMIEVPAPCDCVIETVLKANGELASFGEALMRYKPC